jgi:RNA polymerase sigma factor (sigma-70 family)
MGVIDPGQLSGLFDAHSRQLMLYARQWLDAAEAEDVVQDVFIRLMTQKRRPENIKAWLFRSVRNGAISQTRRGKVRKKHAQRLRAERQNWFEPHPDDLIDAATAQTVLEELPGDLREIVLLRIWGQMTLKETAQVVNQPLSTVHRRYKSALEAIRERMEKSCRTKTD